MDSAAVLTPLIEQTKTLFERQGIHVGLKQTFITRRFGNVAIASDYRDEGDTTYKTYVFLCTNVDMLKAWHAKVIELRRDKGLGISEKEGDEVRHMKYSKLNDRKKLEALPEWLSLANTMEGNVVVVTVDKQLDTVNALDLDELKQGIHDMGFESWADKETIERAVNISQIVSYLCSLCTNEGDQFLWLTDDDPIASNLYQERDLRGLVGHLTHKYLDHNIDTSTLWVPRSENLTEDQALFTEDVLSIPDFVCGVASDILTARAKGEVVPDKEKIRIITEFLGDDSGSLKKQYVNISADETDDRMGIGAQLFDIRLQTQSRQSRDPQTPKTETQLTGMVQDHKVAWSTLYQDALEAGVEDPFILIFDLESEYIEMLARNLSTSAGQGEATLEGWTDYAHHHNAVPTMIQHFPRELAVEVCGMVDKSVAQSIRELDTDGVIPVALMSEQKCIIATYRVDEVLNAD